MNRHKALAVAGATAAILSGAAAAFAVNLGLLGAAGANVPGNLEADEAIAAFDSVEPTTTSAATAPTTSTPEVIVRYEDVYVPAGTVDTRAVTAPASATPPTPAPATSPFPSTSTTADDDQDEHEDKHEVEHEDDEHEHEEDEHEDDEHEVRDGDEDDD